MLLLRASAGRCRRARSLNSIALRLERSSRDNLPDEPDRNRSASTYTGAARQLDRAHCRFFQRQRCAWDIAS
jgi:hypothetical protein